MDPGHEHEPIGHKVRSSFCPGMLALSRRQGGMWGLPSPQHPPAHPPTSFLYLRNCSWANCVRLESSLGKGAIDWDGNMIY